MAAATGGSSAGATVQRAEAATGWLRVPSVNSSTTRRRRRCTAATSRTAVDRSGRGLQRNGRSTTPS
ncbi:hypothetical protein [Kineococcus sp. SYSU DK002]|uniref:hypothetical protein n=1 Tax=Kineococcus sp. SYSU DK002 TaxID=3383123 RepID=UPI003D7E0F6F